MIIQHIETKILHLLNKILTLKTSYQNLHYFKEHLIVTYKIGVYTDYLMFLKR